MFGVMYGQQNVPASYAETIKHKVWSHYACIRTCVHQVIVILLEIHRARTECGVCTSLCTVHEVGTE